MVGLVLALASAVAVAGVAAAADVAPVPPGKTGLWCCPWGPVGVQRGAGAFAGRGLSDATGAWEWLIGRIDKLLDKAAQALELTQEQKEKLSKLREEAAAGRKALAEETRDKTSELRKEWAKDSPDQERLKTLAGELMELRLRVRQQCEAIKDKVKDILTAEQEKKLNELWNKMRLKLGDRARRGGRWPGGGRGHRAMRGWW
ncbi:MAG: Spy/CpxP family protein refolding chaperone [Chloroflexi bacterium]|nr:Spy/CpxP family protein refolding chaperone [Chloroflexota bacterium]